MLKQLFKKDWKKNAVNYDTKNWSFSSAKAWEKVVKDSPTSFNKIQYVDQLRLIGNYDKAKEVIESIELEDIPDDYKFVYYIRKGTLHQDQGEIYKAIDNFKQSIKYQIKDTYPYVFQHLLYQ